MGRHMTTQDFSLINVFFSFSERRTDFQAYSPICCGDLPSFFILFEFALLKINERISKHFQSDKDLEDEIISLL